MSETSEKQIKANRKNALLGGVKTDIGKAVSRYNAVRHGILRESVSEYEQVSYEKIFNEACSYFEPQNFIEEMLVERIVVDYVRFVRIAKAEGEWVKSALDPTISLGRSITLNDRDGYKSMITPSHVDTLTNVYARYETTIEKRIYRAIDKLRELKRESV